MNKAVYQNPKTQKLYTPYEKDGKNELAIVYDNEKAWDKEQFKVDKKNRPYKVLWCEEAKTKAGYTVFKTVKKEEEKK